MKLHNVITHNVVWAYQATDSFVYHWLRAHILFDVTRFPDFVGASDVICVSLSLS